MSTTGQRPDPARFLQETEQQAREQQLEAVRLMNGGDTLLGLALLLPNLPTETIRQAMTQANCLLTTLPQSHAQGCGLNQAAATEEAGLLALLQNEIDHHRESRLPCSLLLLSLTSAKTRNKATDRTHCQAITAIQPLLDHQDTVVPCDDHTIAVLLPATSLGKARRRAAAIQAALPCGQHLPCCGLSVCHAHEPLSAKDFLQRTRQELERAKTLGQGALCHAALATVDESCQVTVEERAHLFSFLAKD